MIQRLALETDFATAGLFLAGKQLEQGGFPGTVMPDQTDDAPPLQNEIEGMQQWASVHGETRGAQFEQSVGRLAHRIFSRHLTRTAPDG